MGTCWLLEMETMLDLGWNLSAAADKGGRLEGGEGSEVLLLWGRQREGGRKKRRRRSEKWLRRCSEKAALVQQQLLPHKKFETVLSQTQRLAEE